MNYDYMINETQFCMVPGHLESNDLGHLLFSGANTIELLEKYGSPLFLFSEDKIRKNYRMIEDTLKKHFAEFQICFACKSNSLKSVLQILKSEGAYADVVSEGEIYKAQVSGFENKEIVFNGNNKSRKEIRHAIKNKIMINCDSQHELDMIINEARNIKKRALICLRVNCDVAPGVIPEFSTALKNSKFGVDLNEEAYSAFQLISSSPHVEALGIHCHIGSQIEDTFCYNYAITKIMDLCVRLYKELKIELKIINVGGGYGVPFEYLGMGDAFASFASEASKIFHAKLRDCDMKSPAFYIEPGALIIGTSAIALMRVGTIKEKKDKALIAVDCGADVLLRATQSWYTYRAICANKLNHENEIFCDIVGPLCYEGDILARNRQMPSIEENDVIAMIDVGAYTTTLFNNYNGKPSPAILMIDVDGNERIVQERQTVEQLIDGEHF